MIVNTPTGQPIPAQYQGQTNGAGYAPLINPPLSLPHYYEPGAENWAAFRSAVDPVTYSYLPPIITVEHG